MNFNLDIAIFTGFLIINFIMGLYYSGGVTNLKEYAVGKKEFSTNTITATVIATCIGGGFFSGGLSESYRQGLYFIIPAIGEPLGIIIVGYFLAPRMAEFLNTLSVAEAMGNIYGKTVQFITALMGIFLCIGIVALQFKVGASMLKNFFGFSSFYAVLSGAIIIIIYSTFGGIKAVTFTDIIQFFTFGTIIPILSLIIWGTLNDPYEAFVTLNQNPLFDLTQVFDLSNTKFINTIFLLLFFLVPSLDPAFFQRVIIAKNVVQAKKAFIFAGIVCLVLLLVINWVGVLLLADNSNLDPNNLLGYLIDKYSYTGLRGLTAAGIMAIIMSTSDSYINVASVMFSNDILKSLRRGDTKVNNELKLSRFFSVFVGFTAFFLAFKAASILELLLLILGVYMPIVSVPLILAILGFRSTSNCVIAGMLSGAITVVFFEVYKIPNLESVVPGMISNFVVMMIYHYLLRQSGGWIGIKDDSYREAMRRERKIKLQKITKYFLEFNLLNVLRKNTPGKESTYSLFGFFCIISVFSTMYSLTPEVRLQYKDLIQIIYHTVLISSTIFLTYPVWPPTFKNDKFIAIVWNLAVPYVLIFSPVLLLIISNFGQFQMMIFMINLIMISMMLEWYTVLLMLGVGSISSFKFFQYIMDISYKATIIDMNLQFKIMYVLLLFSSTLIAFIKPKQEEQALSEKKVDHLSGRVEDREKALLIAEGLKEEFIRNLTHEFHAPMTGIRSTVETLYEVYDQLPEEARKKAVKNIYNSSVKLEAFEASLISLSKLANANYQFDIKLVDLTDLVLKSLNTCRKLYIEDKDQDKRQFIFNAKEKLTARVDEYYFRQTIDNLIINAINYCKEGKISLNLSSNKGYIEFSISDEGVGIPHNELDEIFGAFNISSRTKTPAGGRGVGLALCKKVIDLHDGKIWAQNNEHKGASFKFNIPV